jgi:hypothetical protein
MLAYNTHMAKRTAHRTNTGKQRYSVREKSGKFRDVQSYKRGSAGTVSKSSDTTMKIRLSAKARKKLAARAADQGQDISTYASGLIEQSVTKPTLDEVLAPFRMQVADSGMSDDELDALHEQLRERAWSEGQSQRK